MNRKLGVLLIPGLLVTLTIFARSQGAGEHKSVWNGVYSDEQSVRGQAIYEQYCVTCHGTALTGGASQGAPQLAGDKFVENWREDTAEDLFLKIRNTMPRRGFQGNDKVLTDNETLDLVSFIFKKNNFPAGSELKDSAIGSVWIEQQQGPKPLPNYSQVQILGCMDQEADNWNLVKASQPTRLRASGETVDPAILKAAQTKPLGTLKFRLQNLTMLGAFTPEPHKGHKMLAQGALIRQAGGDRISVTQLEMLSANCDH